MSDLLHIQEQLRDTNAAIAKSEQAIALDPSSKAVGTMLRSFQKRQQKLESEFAELAKHVGTDVCSYRFFSDDVQQKITPVCLALIDFQSLYSLAYDAIKSGAKKPGRRLPPEVVDESAFGFGYTFSGSLGVVMTFDNSKRLLFETVFDESMGEVAALAQATSSAEVLECGKRVGVPVVRAAHKWAATHAEAALGAEIAWKKGDEVLWDLLLEPRIFADLAETIRGTTEIVVDEVEMVARLVGADVKGRTFHLVLADGSDLRGTIANEIPADRDFPVALGRPHKLKLRKRVKVYYATEKEESATYQLVEATPSSWPNEASPAQ
jgi:hypothetical protein